MRAASKTTLGFSQLMFERRRFLHALGASAVVTTAPGLVTEANADSETHDEKRKSRYQTTDHVKTFYRVNSYPR